jgi:uncharacterized oligopeptide transporter (OPT) family protein
VLAGALPWGLVLSGAGLAVGALLCSVSPLAFAIGVYLPLATMAAIYLGGCVRALSTRRTEQEAAREEKENDSRQRGKAPQEAAREDRKDKKIDAGILAASGLVAGEGLAGVLVAGLVAAQLVPRSLPPRLPGLAGELAVVAMLAGVCVFLYRAR